MDSVQVSPDDLRRDSTAYFPPFIDAFHVASSDLFSVAYDSELASAPLPDSAASVLRSWLGFAEDAAVAYAGLSEVMSSGLAALQLVADRYEETDRRGAAALSRIFES